MKTCLQCAHIFSTDGWRCAACGYEPSEINGFRAHNEACAHNGGGFKPEYFAELAELEAENFWFRARNELIIRTLGEYTSNNQSFLEVGCGTGYVLSGIAEAQSELELFGSEIFIAGLKHAAERVPSATFMQMDARQLPFVSEFDFIGLFDVLEHIEEDETVLCQIHQALKAEGKLILTVPQHPWLWSPADEYACHVRRYTSTELNNKLVKSGFSVERSTSFVSFLLPAMLLSRLKKRSGGYDPRAEMSLPKPVNSLFLSLMRLELGLLKRGVNLPIGGSRLIVARKKELNNAYSI